MKIPPASINRIPLALLLIFAITVTGCVGVRHNPPEACQGTTIPFTRSDVEGWKYELLSMSNVHSIQFKSGGDANAIIGSGKTLAAPAYQWEIDTRGRLVISDDEGPRAIYQLLSKSPNKVELWDMKTGRSAVFFRSRSA